MNASKFQQQCTRWVWSTLLGKGSRHSLVWSCFSCSIDQDLSTSQAKCILKWVFIFAETGVRGWTILTPCNFQQRKFCVCTLGMTSVMQCYPPNSNNCNSVAVCLVLKEVWIMKFCSNHFVWNNSISLIARVWVCSSVFKILCQGGKHPLCIGCRNMTLSEVLHKGLVKPEVLCASNTFPQTHLLRMNYPRVAK